MKYSSRRYKNLPLGFIEFAYDKDEIKTTKT